MKLFTTPAAALVVVIVAAGCSGDRDRTGSPTDAAAGDAAFCDPSIPAGEPCAGSWACTTEIEGSTGVFFTEHRCVDGVAVWEDAGFEPYGDDPPVEPPAVCVATCASARDFYISPAVSEADRIFNEVVEIHLDDLYRLVGRFACGDDAVYVGTLGARDDKGDLYGPPYENDQMIDGPVIASLHVEWPPPWNGSATLEVLSPTQRRRVQISQVPHDPTWTEGSTVAGFDESYLYNHAMCSDCAPPLPYAPDEIAIDGLEGIGVTVDWHLSMSGHLTRVAPEEITLEQLDALNQGWGATRDAMGAFETSGHEQVRRVDRELRERIDVVDDSWDSCERVTNYAVELYVDSSCPSTYGARHAEIVSQQTCCSALVECPPDRSTCDFRTECL